MSAGSSQRIDGAAAYAEAADRLIRQANTEVLLQTDALDRRLYGQDAFNEAVRQFVLSSTRARLKVLVRDPASAIAGGCRLIELGRSLSSHIEFRALPSDQQAMRDERLIADNRRLLHRARPQDTTALASDDPLQARQHAQAFAALWEVSTPAQELRRLGI